MVPWCHTTSTTGPSLWVAIGGQQRAREVNREIARHVDVMIGNAEDFTAALGFEVSGTSADFSQLAVEGFGAMIAEVAAVYPNFRVIATTLRTVRSATISRSSIESEAATRSPRG